MKKLALSLFLLTSLAQADVRYTKKVTFHNSDSPGEMAMQTTTYLKNRRERVDTLTEMGPMKMHQSELTLCDKELRARIDSELKIYTASSLRPQFTELRNPTQPPEGPAPVVKPGTGTYTMTYKVQDLGKAKVANLDTHHYRVHMTMVSTGCAGDGQTELDREVWMAELPHLNCPLRDATGDFSMKSDNDPNPCKIKVIQQGDVALYRAATSGEAVKEILYQNGTAMMTTELTDYSSAPLDDALFSLDGLTSVSDDEFQQQMQAKMMRQFRP